ncbi:MAG: inositol monophosphatase family protein [Candidatus Aadella gelida]|nr:inositol monophosphatase family protein [Candidatus Aadella gelida]
MDNLTKIKEVAIMAAQSAGEYVVSRVGNIREIKHKGGINNIVTDADKASEKMIIDLITKEFPEHSILAEESGMSENKSGIKWIIDPIDGTTNFAHGFPVFCVSIGVAIDGEVAVGAVYDPTRKELFVGEKGKGATINGNPIRVSGCEKVNESLISTGFAYDKKKKEENFKNFKTMMNNAQAVRRPGSAAIDLCYVACGRFDGFWEMYLSPWDTAAGQLMVKETGGKVTGFGGDKFDIYDEQLLATNGLIHDEMIALLGQ